MECESTYTTADMIPEYVYYINLEHRTDRRAQMEDWLESSGWLTNKITRIEAVSVPGRGHLGCTASHINTLLTFLDSPHNLCVVLEDDFEPCCVETFWHDVEEACRKAAPFDILMLANNMLIADATDKEGIMKVKKCFTSSGYIITREFAPRLIQNMYDGLQLAQAFEREHLTKANDFCLDVHWEKLMPESQWLAIVPALGKQRDGFSDIQGHFVSYNA
jgi:hypothetical protein